METNTTVPTARPLDSIVVKTSENCEYSVIWLHGLGASGHDFEPIVPELKLLHRPGVKFLFPHAPIRPITINGGSVMRGWYDITSLDFDQRSQDASGMRESRQAVNQLIQLEMESGIPAGNIILAGFSQGGALALYTALTYPQKLGGVLALSTYLPMQSELGLELNTENLNIPLFFGHGLHDDVINIRYAEQSRDALISLGAKPEWHTYQMPHSVSLEEIQDIEKWFKRLLGM